MYKDFQQMRCLDGVSVEVDRPAQFRNGGGVRWKYTFSFAVYN